MLTIEIYSHVSAVVDNSQKQEKIICIIFLQQLGLELFLFVWFPTIQITESNVISTYNFLSVFTGKRIRKEREVWDKMEGVIERQR